MVIAEAESQAHAVELEEGEADGLSPAHGESQFPLRPDADGLFFRMEQISDPLQEQYIRQVELKIKGRFLERHPPQREVRFQRVHQKSDVLADILVG